MQRHGQIIRIKPECFQEYRRLHAAVWPEVLERIAQCNIRNYSIFHKDGLLFAFFEYTGVDFEADMAKMAEDPKTREWWSLVGPMQQPLETRRPGEGWAEMENLFHFDGTPSSRNAPIPK